MFALRLCRNGFNSLQKGRAEVFEGTCDDLEPLTQCKDIAPGLFKLPIFCLRSKSKTDFGFSDLAMTIATQRTSISNTKFAGYDMSVFKRSRTCVVSAS
ncbi:hypothetical protein HY17_01075 [Hyphomonas sp. CY54-11-8]|nr:hypothetical protein HY17_01075 [Hyphomonas sp. CY54-11-8]